jgi:hypothetical protein
LYDTVNSVNREVCLFDATTQDFCWYYYAPCNNGWYILRTKFESTSNIIKYTDDPLQNASWVLNSINDYDLWSCDALINIDDLENGLID